MKNDNPFMYYDPKAGNQGENPYDYYRPESNGQNTQNTPNAPLEMPPMSIEGDIEEDSPVRLQRVQEPDPIEYEQEVDVDGIRSGFNRIAEDERKVGAEESARIKEAGQIISSANIAGQEEFLRTLGQFRDLDSQESLKRSVQVAQKYRDHMASMPKRSTSDKVLQFIGLAISGSAGPKLLGIINRQIEADADRWQKQFGLKFPGAKQLSMADQFRIAAERAKLVVAQKLKSNPKAAQSAAKVAASFNSSALKYEADGIKQGALSQQKKRDSSLKEGIGLTGGEVRLSQIESKYDKNQFIKIPGTREAGYIVTGDRNMMQKDLDMATRIRALLNEYEGVMNNATRFDKVGGKAGGQIFSKLTQQVNRIRGELGLYMKSKAFYDLGVLQSWDLEQLERVLPFDMDVIRRGVEDRYQQIDSMFEKNMSSYLQRRGIGRKDQRLYNPTINTKKNKK